MIRPDADPGPERADPAGSAGEGADASPRRAIRSYVLRQGRTSPAQIRAVQTLLPRLGIEYRVHPIDFNAVFGRDAPTVLEIGFGMGETTAQIAQALPATNFVGIEVHTPGVGTLLRRIDAARLSNIRIIQHDAVEVVNNMIRADSLAGIHIFFPDPWPKKRHHKRRLIQKGFVAMLASRLATGGYLHLATDWEEYAQQMLELVEAEPLLGNTAAGFALRPDYRPLTKFEQRGLNLGHGVWDVVFRRI